MVTILAGIIAYADDGARYPKTVRLVTSHDKDPILSFGRFETYYLDSLRSAASTPPDHKFYLELRGRNHDGKPVYIHVALFRSLVAMADKLLTGNDLT